jgi:hypothetical protein
MELTVWSLESVKPPYGLTVLVYDQETESYGLGKWDFNTHSWQMSYIYKVTHWAHLPHRPAKLPPPIVAVRGKCQVYRPAGSSIVFGSLTDREDIRLTMYAAPKRHIWITFEWSRHSYKLLSSSKRESDLLEFMLAMPLILPVTQDEPYTIKLQDEI